MRCALPGGGALRRVDLCAVPEGELPFALLHFTGDRAFTLMLRRRARLMGLTLNEHGLCGAPSPPALAGERGVLEFLGVPWVPPRKRQGYTAPQHASGANGAAGPKWRADERERR